MLTLQQLQCGCSSDEFCLSRQVERSAWALHCFRLSQTSCGIEMHRTLQHLRDGCDICCSLTTTDPSHLRFHSGLWELQQHFLPKIFCGLTRVISRAECKPKIATRLNSEMELPSSKSKSPSNSERAKNHLFSSCSGRVVQMPTRGLRGSLMSTDRWRSASKKNLYVSVIANSLKSELFMSTVSSLLQPWLLQLPPELQHEELKKIKWMCPSCAQAKMATNLVPEDVCKSQPHVATQRWSQGIWWDHSALMASLCSGSAAVLWVLSRSGSAQCQQLSKSRLAHSLRSLRSTPLSKSLGSDRLRSPILRFVSKTAWRDRPPLQPQSPSTWA